MLAWLASLRSKVIFLFCEGTPGCCPGLISVGLSGQKMERETYTTSRALGMVLRTVIRCPLCFCGGGLRFAGIWVVCWGDAGF